MLGSLISANYPKIMNTQAHLQKRNSRQGLRKPTRQSRQGIEACPPNRVIDIFGNLCSRVDLVQTMLHHELFHHGMFSVYAHEMKFDLPRDWRDFWWIPLSVGG